VHQQIGLRQVGTGTTNLFTSDLDTGLPAAFLHSSHASSAQIISHWSILGSSSVSGSSPATRENGLGRVEWQDGQAILASLARARHCLQETCCAGSIRFSGLSKARGTPGRIESHFRQRSSIGKAVFLQLGQSIISLLVWRTSRVAHTLRAMESMRFQGLESRECIPLITLLAQPEGRFQPAGFAARHSARHP
jgi:hypothetical protein